MEKYKLKTSLLHLHMNCNLSYISGHAKIAGEIAKNEIRTLEEYNQRCNKYGISSYNITAEKYYNYDKRVFKFDPECTTPLADKLISLYAKYVEGGINASRDNYNKLIRNASNKDMMYLIYRTPFERQAYRLYSLLIDDGTKFPEIIINKVKKDKEFIDKLNKLSC